MKSNRFSLRRRAPKAPRRAPRPLAVHVDGLETRITPAIMAMKVGAVLVITGDGTSETLTVSGGSTVSVSGTGYAGPASFTGVSSVNINTDGGDDNINATGLNRLSTIDGGTGNDTILGGSLADSILGGDGDDSIRSNSGADTVQGGIGNDSIAGGTAADSLVGDLGDDLLVGEAGNDTILGGDGSDTVDGDTGADSISTGLGDDRIDANSSEALNDTNNAGAGVDTLRNTGSSDLVLANFDRDNGFEVVDGNGEGIDGTAAGNVLNFNNITLNGVTSINGLGGDDTIIGSTANDTILGDDGDDSINGGDGSDLIFGNDDNDTITPDGAAQGVADVVFAGEGDDTILVAGNRSLTDSFDGGNGTDTIQSARAGIPIGLMMFDPDNDIEVIDALGSSIIGTAGDDVLDFSNTMLVNVSKIFVQTGDDEVIGSAGDDTIDAGRGNDSLTGGAGTDTFVIPNNDPGDAVVITDFDSSSEFLDLQASFAQVEITSDGMGGTLITLPTGKTIQLEGVDPNTLTAANFI